MSRVPPRFPAPALVLAIALALGTLGGAASPAAADGDAAALSAQASGIFGPLPSEAPNPANPMSEAKVALGRTLYFDARLSKNHDVSCNSCHLLDRFGVDGEPTSKGHRGQRGDRNSPTVYNAALHASQFWDGREPDVEAQALGPPLNPIEMAMASPEAVESVLLSIPDYPVLFAGAFPGEEEPVTYANMGRAIGAFERTLLTPGPIDDFMKGELDALNAQQQRGLATFVETGCITCHMGPAIGGTLLRQLGQVNPYETSDTGRHRVTGKEEDRKVFKVPGLRNAEKTGPYFHDGSIATLDEAIRRMAYHQLGVELTDAQVADVAAFIGSLTGPIDPATTAPPELPASGPNTPAPDPT